MEIANKDMADIQRVDINTLSYMISDCYSNNEDVTIYKSGKENYIYAVIDYLDWLYYVNSVSTADSGMSKSGTDLSKLKSIDKSVSVVSSENILQSVHTIVSKCSRLMKLLEDERSSKTLEELAKLYKGSDSDKAMFDLLYKGYRLFVDEMAFMQKRYVKGYKRKPNGKSNPILIIPFSRALYRLTNYHYNIKEYDTPEGYKIDIERGKIQDFIKYNKERKKYLMPFDFGIRTYTFDKYLGEAPYNLPSEWHISSEIEDSSKTTFKYKSAIISDCYSQYCYVGETLFDKETGMIVLGDYEDNITNTEDTVFLLNYPYLIKRVKMVEKIINGENINQIKFEKM